MALGTTLPTWPALLFTYLEPISLLLGVHAVYSNPTSFITKQLPLTPNTASTPIPASAYVLAYSLGSIFLLLALLAILCTAITREPRVTKYYLAMLACGDLGHLYANYRGLGSEAFWDFGKYNEVMAGNVWITVFLWGMRVLTLGGVFGRLGRRV